ncbi:hypothetical protein PUNSTDRAFT_41835 [Punctularia strigosozonata HHB-11173 SS5]|uniref:uncharacterized protein n=1 Tax=Punctularia strigosozonata (strain HHB-11173) TaxID=741275 RepID=UPI000441791E|nr:uncharacterized protein PUNSTDRAFT_41835 [Punctularia strigosozonata HHB-11173 SS5]EIN14706.1 hypothetical protein PUNSTDRAFT_41835 [Punctularia strigosozonata HHB-11173 SS5]
MLRVVASFVLILWTACASGTYLDGPHVPLATANSTAEDPFQWWYFDLVADSGSALEVVYYSGYGFGNFVPVPYYLQITSTVPNGTHFGQFAVSPGSATVEHSTGAFSNGIWPSLGGWNSTRRGYVVTFQNTDGTVSGNLTLDAVAPAHYPCDGSADPSFNTTVAPNLVGPWLGWANAVPTHFKQGATATGFLTLGNETFSYSGSGYHDSNFGLKQLSETANHWYWGRGRVGPYTLVYFSYLPKNSSVPATDPNAWYTSGYLSLDGVQILDFCSAEQSVAAHAKKHLAIETSGAIWSEGPDVVGNPDNSTVSIAVTYSLNAAEYKFNMTSIAVGLAGSPLVPYARWTSSITGGRVGGETYTGGRGFFELLNYGE